MLEVWFPCLFTFPETFRSLGIFPLKLFLFYFLKDLKNILVLLLLHLHLWVSSSSSAGIVRWHTEGPQADQTHDYEQATSSFSSVISSFVKCTTILHQRSHRVEVKTKKNPHKNSVCESTGKTLPGSSIVVTLNYSFPLLLNVNNLLWIFKIEKLMWWIIWASFS